MLPQRVLVTGGSGFVGKALAAKALSNGSTVRISSRQKLTAPKSRIEYCQVGDLSPATDWFVALQGVDAVVHCAGRAHVMTETAVDPFTAFRTVNGAGTLKLACQAVEAGVKRFVFVSSVGVNGLHTALGKPFSETDKPNPHNAYALSKWEAEQGLLRIAATTGMEVVILRPPLVYGPNAPGNFGSLMRWLQRYVPLPLGAIHNQRSLVALDNLVDLIVICLTHPAAANQIFLVSDDDDVSTTELLRRMGQAMGRPALLVPVPASWLKLAATLVGKQDMAQRLCSSLQVDIAKTRDLLGWRPPLSLDQGLKKAAEGCGRETVV